MEKETKDCLEDAKNYLKLSIHSLYGAIGDTDTDNCNEDESDLIADIESRIYQLDKEMVLINEMIESRL